MKDLISRVIFVIVDILIIMFSIYLAYYIRINLFEIDLAILPLNSYLTLYPLYIVPIVLFAYEGLYTKRYDFWQESKIELKAIFFSAILVFAYLAMTKISILYSRLIIASIFIIMAIFIPISKKIVKNILYIIGLWQKEATVYKDDPFLSKEIYKNHHLGYIKPKNIEKSDILFINSKNRNIDSQKLNNTILEEIKDKKEVIFVPIIDNYNLSQSTIYQLFNTRTNLIVFKNRLKNRYIYYLKEISDLILTIIFTIIFAPIMAIVALMLKRSEPNEPIIFKQKRLGKNGKSFVCYKFRTMQSNSRVILKEYLQNNPKEIEYFKKYHKYKNDPRVTKLGAFLRKTSLDELPQLLNIFKHEMSLVGPRPYMPKEKKYIKDSDIILSVKPGLTGLWQVSGRSKTDFKTRAKLDKWYVNNWSVWLDFTILIKTIKAVIKQEGSS